VARQRGQPANPQHAMILLQRAKSLRGGSKAAIRFRAAREHRILLSPSALTRQLDGQEGCRSYRKGVKQQMLTRMTMSAVTPTASRRKRRDWKGSAIDEAPKASQVCPGRICLGNDNLIVFVALTMRLHRFRQSLVAGPRDHARMIELNQTLQTIRLIASGVLKGKSPTRSRKMYCLLALQTFISI
jgi:hypothetical protein